MRVCVRDMSGARVCVWVRTNLGLALCAADVIALIDRQYMTKEGRLLFEPLHTVIN